MSQTEVQGLLDALKATLIGTSGGRITYAASGYFKYDAATDRKLTNAGVAQKRAAYNWCTVSFDGGKGVHNAVRTVQRLQRSIRELDPAAIPDAILL